MLTKQELFISILICILLSIIIKINFFNNEFHPKNIPNKSQPSQSPEQKETQSDNNYPSKISNTKLYKVINIFPRKNPTVYTQGLIYYNQSLFESGGLYYKSTLTHMEFPSQKIIKKINLENKYFAEGIASSSENNILYQLTYKEKEILLYSFPDLNLIKKMKMPEEMREGWGLCYCEEKKEFYATDGSDKIFILNIDKNNNELKLKKIIKVTKDMRPVYQLNELITDGIYIYSNVYFSDKILKINPNNGQVMNIYDMTPLIEYEIKNGNLTSSRMNRGDVLNGIAYIPEKKSFILTGKLWNYYFEVIFS